MIKRTSRNFKVPLVFGGQWKDHQTFQKWDPISKRLVQVNCCSTLTCKRPPTSTANNVSFLIISSHGGSISWNYGGIENQFEVAVYESSTLPVNTSAPPVYIDSGILTSPYPAGFTITENYYYVASVRVKNDCGYSGYSYSSPVQFICPLPDPISEIVLSGLTGSQGTITWGNYDGTDLEINIYEGSSLPVDTSGVPIFSMQDAFTKPYTATFSQTPGYYYVASVRAINDCGYSTYSYSDPVQLYVDPVDVVTLMNIITGSADVVWSYSGSETIFEVSVYGSGSLPVSTSIPLQTYEGSFTSPYSFLYSFTNGYYYVASVRVKSAGGIYSDYTYSSPEQYMASSYEYINVYSATNTDPGTGNFSAVVGSYPSFTLNFNKTDKNSSSADAYFNSITPGTTSITVTKNPMNYYTFATILSVSNTNYWSFTTTLTSSEGTLNVGDTVAVSYDIL